MQESFPVVGKNITGTVIKVTDSEVLVDVGYMFEGTIYKDHLTLKKLASAKEFCQVGDEITAKVTKISHGDDSGVLLLSRLDIEKAQLREEFINELEVDKIVEAKVKHVNKGGFELDFHGIQLFMPFSMASLDELSEDDKKSFLGKKLMVKIIEKKETKGRENFVVSHKQVMYEEKKTAEKAEFSSFKEGDIVTGKVTKLLPFGAVVSLGTFTDGFLHISELSQYHTKDVTEVVHLDDEVTAKIISIQKKKISLSLKALQETPWNLFLKNHKVGDEVTATVVKKMQFGMLLEVEREVTGLLNRNDYSWDPQVNLAGQVEIGSKLNVKILSINKDKKQFQLSKKHLEYNPWADVSLKVGEIVSGVVKSFQEKGAILEIQGVEAYLPIGEISDDHISKPEDALKLGDSCSVEVVTFFPKEWKLTVSRKKIIDRNNRQEYEEQLKDNVSANQSLADLFKNYKK